MVAGISSSELAKIGDSTPGGIHLQRHIGGIAAIHALPDLALGVLDQHPPLRAFHEHHEGDDREKADEEGDDEEGGKRAGGAQLQNIGDGDRQIGDDTGEDDQGNPIADPAGGDLLTPATSKTMCRQPGSPHR